MSRNKKLRAYLYGTVAFGVASLASTGAIAAPCQGPGAPTTTQTKCVTAILLPKPLQSYDISWVNPQRAEYYLADRSNNAIDIIDTQNLTYKRSLGLGLFKGLKFNATGTAGDNNHSGPNGVVTHGRWVYAGDGDSTLKVLDLDSPPALALKATISTGGTTRLDEMALTTDGKYLIAANNAEDPPFATLFTANGDAPANSVSIIRKTIIAPSIVPSGFGLSIEQPTWDPKTKRFYTSVPIIANNPTGCNYGQLTSPPPGTPNCSGGLLVTDPLHPKSVEGAFDPVTNTGVVPLINCGPNGATTADFDNLLLGCTPGNLPGSTTTLVINAKTKNQTSVNGITGSDEVWFNEGDDRYYLGASKAVKPAGSPLGSGAVLGVVNITSVLVETIPQSSGSHSVAADSKRNLIFVPQNFTRPVTTPLNTGNVGTDTNTTAGAGSPTVGQLICGSNDGCIAVYRHNVDDDDEHEDRDREHDRDRDRR
jgi:hypothetical protein